MRPAPLDPTAGERARASRVDPFAQPIVDPTDPRHSESALEYAASLSTERVLDPTDPEYGQLVGR